MIKAGGKNFITLMDDIYVNGEKVTAAYMNGIQVYPVMSGEGITGSTTFKMIYVGEAYISVKAEYACVDWGDGAIDYFITGNGRSGTDFSHDYEDLEFHLVTLVMVTRPDYPGGQGYISFKSVGGAGPGYTELSLYENWVWNSVANVAPYGSDSDYFLPVRSIILSKYRNATIAWSVEGSINTTIMFDYANRIEATWEHNLDGSVNANTFRMSVDFDGHFIRYIDGTIYINGKRITPS